MSEPRYQPDQRSEADALAALARAARGADLPSSLADADAGRTRWSDLLFSGDAPRNALEPSQALLGAIARLVTADDPLGAARHFNSLPARALRSYLEDRLQIPRLPPLADRVTLVAEGDPKRLPASLPAGSIVVAGTDQRGAERRYATTDQLTVLGASVAALHSHRVLEDRDVIVRREGAAASAPDASYHPFGSADESGATAAPHELYIVSRLLNATAGTLTATLTFADVANPTAARAVLDTLTWEVPRKTGYEAITPDSVTARQNPPGVEVVLSIADAIAATPVGALKLPHVRARFPDLVTGEDAPAFSRDGAFALTFTDIELSVHAVAVPATAGLYNGGVLDITKEFQPFGPVPRRGDSFYLQLDEAFSKPLEELWLNLELLERESGAPVAQFKSISYRVWAGTGEPFGIAPTESASRVTWQTYSGGAWQELAEAQDFEALHEAGMSDEDELSAAHNVGGIDGHFLRAFLFRGDFGWEDYLKEMADIATEIARGAGSGIDPIRPPPDPPVVTRMTVDYATHARSAGSPGGDVALRARNGLGEPLALEYTGGALSPFVEQPDGSTGVLYLGIDDAGPGELATIFFEIEEASACAAIADAGALSWELRAAGGSWSAMEVIDGTLGLRQSGIVRLATRSDWALGASEVQATKSRWVRVRVQEPELVGRIASVTLDAVEAAYLIPDAYRDVDETPATAIAVGTAKGPKAAIPGIKKLTNPTASYGGRGPEADASYFPRASGVTRHRDRAVTAWDVEEIVRAGFPEVAMLRCLPHRSYDSERAPGWLAVVVVPHSTTARPQPSVRLAAEIERAIAERATSHAQIAVLCPDYAAVTVVASLKLRRGFGAAPARDAIGVAIAAYLHPLATARRSTGFGRGLALSEITRLLEQRPEVDFVRDVRFGGDHANTEHIDVDEQLGLIASADEHTLQVEATL